VYNKVEKRLCFLNKSSFGDYIYIRKGVAFEWQDLPFSTIAVLMGKRETIKGYSG